jgi:hypothetical protein
MANNLGASEAAAKDERAESHAAEQGGRFGDRGLRSTELNIVDNFDQIQGGQVLVNILEHGFIKRGARERDRLVQQIVRVELNFGKANLHVIFEDPQRSPIVGLAVTRVIVAEHQRERRVGLRKIHLERARVISKDAQSVACGLRTEIADIQIRAAGIEKADIGGLDTGPSVWDVAGGVGCEVDRIGARVDRNERGREKKGEFIHILSFRFFNSTES